MDILNSTAPVKVKVNIDLIDLIPQFVTNRKNEILKLKLALEDKNFEELRRAGHTLKGVCGSYGFKELGELGRELEECASKADTPAIEKALSQMNFIIDNHTIEIIED